MSRCGVGVSQTDTNKEADLESADWGLRSLTHLIDLVTQRIRPQSLSHSSPSTLSYDTPIYPLLTSH